jgi:hypothetical protein
MKWIWLIISAFLLTVLNQPALAQEESPWAETPELTLSGYLGVFYSYDINQPTTNTKQPFFYSYNRHNEFNVNLAYIGLSIDQAKYRASLKLHTGTYANDNYAAEPGVLKNIYEAYAGISLNKRNNLWLEAGVFPSHLGFESPVAMDNWTLTRSLANENSPYFLTGAKVIYTPSDVVEIMGVVCNGWQRIQMVERNSLLSFGTQLIITPNEKYSMNWSTFVGTDEPDYSRRMMYFSNLFAVMQFTSQFGLLAGFDIGMEQSAKESEKYNTWYVVSAIARYAFTEKWAASLRGEYFDDQYGAVTYLEKLDNGLRTSGVSINVDYMPVPVVACRLEARWLRSPDEIYPKNDSFVQDNVFFTISLEVKLDKKLL